MDLTIEHTDVEGTLLFGTSREDGSADLVKALGWRWSRNIGEEGAWFVRGSRDRAPRRGLIDTTAETLRSAGFTVQVRIDATVTDRAEAEARRAERSQARTERLGQKADREQGRADDRDAAGRDLAERIPFGQPILVGHHSEGRARRDAQRVEGHARASREHQARADQARAASKTSAAATDARNNPITVGNRVVTLTARVARLQGLIAARSGTQGLQGLSEQLERDQKDLTYWQEVRAQQIADGTATDYSRETVSPGDAVKIGGTWHIVKRANRKTVAVETGYSWAQNVPWHKVQGHMPATSTPQVEQ